VTDYIDQNIDDPRRLQLLRDSCRSQLLPLGPLRGSPLWFGAEVQVGILELLSGQRVILDENSKRIVHSQLKQILKFAVGLACRRYLDELDHRCPQCSMSGEADTAMQPNAVAIEVGNAFERVVAPGMAITGQIAGGAENAEDRRPRLGTQRFAKLFQKRHSLAPVQFIKSRKVLRIDGTPSWNNYDSCYHNSRHCSRLGHSTPSPPICFSIVLGYRAGEQRMIRNVLKAPNSGLFR